MLILLPDFDEVDGALVQFLQEGKQLEYFGITMVNKKTIKQLKKNLPKNIKLIMFDYDGTLMDTFLLTCHIYNEFFRQFKIDKTFTKRQFQELFESDWREALKKLQIITPAQWKKCTQIYNEQAADFENDYRCYPYIEEILSELHKKYRLAIISNGNKENIMSKLKKCNILQYFDYVSGYEGGEKPSPVPLQKCMQQFNVTPKETVYIGDMDGDIIAGKAAKVQTVIAVTYGYHHHSRLMDADIVVHTPQELLAIFN